MKSQRPYLRGLALGAITLLALAFSACSPATPAAPFLSGGGAGDYAPTEAAMEEVMTEAPAPEAEYADDASAVLDNSKGQVAQATQAAPGQGDDENPLVNALPQDRLIIKNGQVTLLVENTRTAIDQVTQIAVDNDGYLLSSQAALDTQGVMNATLTIAVRADQYETALRRLRQIAIEVQQEISTGEDVTSEYVDLNSRLTNLEATRDRIAKLLEQAKTVDEALKINQQLADIEGQIEQVKGRMNYLSGRSAFSTITVNLNQKVDATPTPTPTITPTPTPTSPWSIGPTIAQATSTQVDLLRVLLQLIVWLVFVPGPYALVVGLAIWGYSRWSKGRRAKSPPPESKP